MCLIGRKYKMRRTLGEGNFAKVKLAENTYTGQMVAIKIIDKMMVFRDELMEQVVTEISAMNVLDHPNIVRIHEVSASKTKIFIVMEYVSGGEVLRNLNYRDRFNEQVSRKYFQQLIDAVDYCHERGIYHRDLKPENLLIDYKGDLKVTDFGLSAFHKPDIFLTTACGSPQYIAPEVIAYKFYEGAPVDIWACGVILYEFLAGKTPFEGNNLPSISRKIKLGKFEFPIWFTESQRNLISKMLNPTYKQRIKMGDIFEDEWFKTDHYSMHSQGIQIEQHFNLQLRKGDDYGQKTKLESEYSLMKTIQKVKKEAAKNAGLFIENTKDAKVIQLTPQHCLVEISKYDWGFVEYDEFCKSLSIALKKKPNHITHSIPNSKA
ncbi:CBL-interacting protein kinase 14 [Zostera marina]|uniref:non-specific serine/threonine protein kinase n=1 Tax=Zostera marina TaxID=29655 RepID=A0A0K9PJS2_ZOSMR|nr:CBL-interacting protein kinase 14 [Zostera marina]